MSFEEELGNVDLSQILIENLDEVPTVEKSENEELEEMNKRFYEAVVGGTDESIKASFKERINRVIIEASEISAKYHMLVLFEPHNSIDDNDLDTIFSSLKKSISKKGKDICLILLSRGGSIEAAYQISKLCKQWSANKFVVAIPRYAKSAATLIALGADEIHIGPLGQLGPIDPQLGGQPALSVSQALHTIAQVSEKHPGSSVMFAEYLRKVLTVEQIGYCDRIAQSASQYAQRLLSGKESIADRVEHIANRLVQEYKDHAFVIDLEESRELMGDALVKSDTCELDFAERLYELFEEFNYFLKYRNKKILLIGDLTNDLLIIERKPRT